MSKLGDLITAAGTTPGALAAKVGIDATFLDRVLARRQPLPIDVAQLIASAIGSDLGTILGAAGLVTKQTGPVYRRAVPPDLLRGDIVSAESLGRTVPVMAQPRSSIVAMVCGAGVAGGSSGVAFVDRALGPVSTLPFAHATRPFEMALGPGGLVYTAGQTAFAVSMAVVQQTPKIVSEVASPSTLSCTGVAYEESTNTIWVASDVAHGVVRIASLAPLTTTSFPLTIQGHAATPFCIVCHGGFVYVTVTGTSSGGVLKIDPNTGAVVQHWTGILGAFGITNNGNTLMVTSGADLFAIFGSDEDPTLLTWPTTVINGGGWIGYFAGAYWVSSVGTDGPRISRIVIDESGTAAVVIADYILGSGATGIAGHVSIDVDGFVWASVPDQGQVRILDPTLTTGDPTVQIFTVGGTPEGILIL